MCLYAKIKYKIKEVTHSTAKQSASGYHLRHYQSHLQQDLIVAYYCAPFVNGVIGQEESSLVYIKDVLKLVDECITIFSPQVIAAGSRAKL